MEDVTRDKNLAITAIPLFSTTEVLNLLTADTPPLQTILTIVNIIGNDLDQTWPFHGPHRVC